jgi:hypothetical protein
VPALAGQALRHRDAGDRRSRVLSVTSRVARHVFLAAALSRGERSARAMASRSARESVYGVPHLFKATDFAPTARHAASPRLDRDFDWHRLRTAVFPLQSEAANGSF